jgi:hypothetical protein
MMRLIVSATTYFSIRRLAEQYHRRRQAYPPAGGSEWEDEHNNDQRLTNEEVEIMEQNTGRLEGMVGKGSRLMVSTKLRATLRGHSAT